MLVFLLYSNVSCIPFGYYNRLAQHQTDILRAKTPIKTVLNDSTISDENKEKLKLVLEVRKFASENLGLEVGSNYLDYVPLKEDAVSFVVNAAEPYALVSYNWRYPIVGKLPYKGFPTKKEAEEEAKQMESKGYDVFVRGVSAYSTLGWFDDPIFSSMLSLSKERLVETIIHESVHATIFYKDDADFNERLATFLGTEGAKLFYQSKQQNDIVAKINRDKEDLLRFNTFIAKEIHDLDNWYKTVLNKVESLEQKKLQKKKRLEQLQDKIVAEGFTKDKPKDINNAKLLLFSTYQGNKDLFINLYAKFNSFKDLIEYLKTVKHSKDIK
ncbi:MAG: aminopeptidase [Bdellovibrionales bacterium]|nr:aminopeptidase [Bdellovibrionales bacterium]